MQPLADLLDVVAELVQPRQGGETLQPEHTLEQRRNAITNRTADTVRATGLRDQSALEQARKSLAEGGIPIGSGLGDG